MSIRVVATVAGGPRPVPRGVAEHGEARGLLLAASGFAAWGLLSPGNEILLRQYTPLWMQAVRTTLAALVLLVVWGPSRLLSAARMLRQRRVAVALFFGTFASFAMFTLAQDRIPAAFTTLGFYTSPLWTALMARPLLGERVGIAFLPTALVLLLGGWLAMTGGGALAAPDTIGMLLAIGSGAAWGLYAVLVRRDAGHVPWQDLLLASLLLALPLFLLGGLLFEPLPALGAFTPLTWRWTFIQVAVPTLLSLGLFQTSLRFAPAGHVNILVGIELAATVLLAYLLLDARFTLVQLAGLALVLVAVTAYLWSHARPRATPIA